MTRSLPLLSAALLATTSFASAQCLEHEFRPTKLPAGWMGWSFDVDGGWGIVGEPGRNVGQSNSGAAHLINATTGKKVRMLVPSEPKKDANFGISVAIDGDLVVIGAYEDADDDHVQDWSGVVYLFDRQTGTELLRLTSPFPSTNALFGRSVAAGGGFVVVGAPQDHRHANMGGAVYVFDHQGTFLHELLSPLVANSIHHGSRIAVDGGIAAVGAPGAHHGVGRIYIYDIATGALLRKLKPASQPGIGRDVALSGNLVATCNHAAEVHLYDHTTGLEIAVHSLPSEFPEPVGFGSVALEGDRLLFGQPFDHGSGPKSGRALLLDALTGEVVQVLAHPSSAPDDWFGHAVHLDNGTAFVGAPLMDNVLESQGAFFMYVDCASIGTSYCGPAVPNSRGYGAELRAFGSDVVTDQNLMLRMDLLPEGHFALFLVSASQAFVPTPGGSSGNLCLGTGIGRYLADVSLSSDLGNAYLAVDLGALPLTPSHAVQPGETWNFQGWYRDMDPGPTSNFTDGRSITFQ